MPKHLSAQIDQGSVNGIVSDSGGAVVPGASVTLTEVDTGLKLTSATNAAGEFSFSPVKIGNYSVQVSHSGFETAVQANLHLNIQQRLNVPIVLQIGAVEQTVTVTTAPPALQTEDASTGQVIPARQVQAIPLSSGNWVYAAQLVAGTAPAINSRGGGEGDFVANGQHQGQNNFVLDGIDNNSNSVDYLNGASYVVLPPPDALAEFRVQTSDYDAEFGHSAGAVINASIKSGTNAIHGDLWEYVRNTTLNTKNWGSLTLPPYHQNRFGATLGFPILRDKLFGFVDGQGDRISSSATNTYTVPTALMRTGNFSELLNPALTSQGLPVQLYQPNSGGSTILACNGQVNVFCPSQISPVAQKILNLYPLPNTNGNLLYNNYKTNLSSQDNTTQWDARVDWNINQSNQAYVRFSYYNDPGVYEAALGPVLDGGGYAGDGHKTNLGQNFMLSYTHEFTPSLVNEFRVGYNYGHFAFAQVGAGTNVSAQLGLGGIPYTPANGGLPLVSITGISGFGTPAYYPSIERENVGQVLDNLTKTIGGHTLKAGFLLQSIRFSYIQPPDGRGNYNFTGLYTSNPQIANTGFGAADFLADQNHAASLSSLWETADARWYKAGFVQDDWRVNKRLTLNFGIRYDYFQPYVEASDNQANFVVNSASLGTGTGEYLFPSSKQGQTLSPTFLNELAKDHITVGYANNRSLVDSDYNNWGPRIGLSYQVNDKTVIRSGWGIFYGALENGGASANLGFNYPYQFTDNFVTPACLQNNCPSLSAQGITLENGFSAAIAGGLGNIPATPGLAGLPRNGVLTPSTQSFNFAVERALSQNMTATVSYVGALGRHLANGGATVNPTFALQNPANPAYLTEPFPDVSVNYYLYNSVSNYNAFEATVQRRFAHGLTFFANYTLSHSLDDDVIALTGGQTFQLPGVLGYGYDYSNSLFDVRNRLTFNGEYELPFGIGRAHLNHNRIADAFVGGWSGDLTFVDQSGEPFSVADNVPGPSGGYAFAIVKRNPFQPGGSPDPSNPGVACPTRVKTVTHWYNPCAFANPVSAANIPVSGPGSLVTSPSQVIPYLGGKPNTVYGPGYEKVNLSLFKSFATFREQSFSLRGNIFNLFNTPAYATPSITGITGAAGAISGTRSLQSFAPDSRFIEIAAKYTF